MALVVETFLRR